MKSNQERVVNSSLWAAYADALGFMSELTDVTGLRRRVHADRVTTTIEWKRLIGGRFGPQVKLPAGCYSDDTQLRLATSRAIQSSGRFDVEAFAKVELPVWISFSLGAGIGTKAGATNLANSSVSWFSNFYQNKEVSYLASGGNGAAMRVQPHVWSAKQRSSPRCYLADVIRNSVCTHGNMRGIVGAALHATLLAIAFEANDIPSPDVWKQALEQLRDLSQIVLDDRELSSFWLPVWEQRTKNALSDEVGSVLSECARDVETLEALAQKQTSDLYRTAVDSIGAFERASRGSGPKTALLAAFLCWAYRRDDPNEVVLRAANLLGSDTDTIGTMAGALLGAVCEQPPAAPLLDRDYIEREAIRLCNISTGKPDADSFSYPDLMRWSPPRNQSSAVSKVNGHFSIAGLGPAEPMGERFRGQGTDQSVWQWMRLSFGQTIIAKMRENLKDLPSANSPSNTEAQEDSSEHKVEVRQAHLFPRGDLERRNSAPNKVAQTVDEMTTEAIRGGFDPALIGRHVLQLSSGPNGIEHCIAYVAIIGKAIRSRIQRGT